MQRTKKEWINYILGINDVNKLENTLDKMYMSARQCGYDDGYCDGIGEGCDYNGRMYDEVAYEWDEENDEPGEKIAYEWDLK